MMLVTYAHVCSWALSLYQPVVRFVSWAVVLHEAKCYSVISEHLWDSVPGRDIDSRTPFIVSDCWQDVTSLTGRKADMTAEKD